MLQYKKDAADAVMPGNPGNHLCGSPMTYVAKTKGQDTIMAALESI